MLLLPENFLSREDEMTRTFLPTTLFVFHADVIPDQLANDLENSISLAYSADRLKRLHAALSTEIAKSHAASSKASRSLG